ILALVESRLGRLGPEARRIVRAASVFGETFWRGGVGALVDDVSASDLDARLGALVEAEVIGVARQSRGSSHEEDTVGHGLLREAGYAMLSEPDRVIAHRLAAEWLEGAGENDALILADHFELGRCMERAVVWLTEATNSALDGGNTAATITLSD